MSSISDLARALWGNQQVLVLLYLTGAVFLTGVAAALKEKNFSLTSLADWIRTYLVPMMLGYAALSLVAIALPGPGEQARDFGWYTLLAAMAGFITRNLCRAFGVPFPQLIAERRTL